MNVISKAAEECKKLRLTIWGKLKISAVYPESIIRHAYERLLQKKVVEDPLDFFLMICAVEAKNRGIKPQWEKADYLRELYNIPIDAPLQLPATTLDDLNKRASPGTCPRCRNKQTVCACGPRSHDIHCICHTIPNKRCRGFAQTNDSNFHPVAAYEHFEKFKNKKGLEFMGYTEDFNPFTEEYRIYNTLTT